MTAHDLPTIDMTTLAHWTDEERSFALIDVLPDDEATPYACGSPAHYLAETDFLDQMKALGIRKTRPIVLYESGLGAIHTEQAAEALLQAGFCEVHRFVGPQSAFHVSQHGQD